MYQLQIELLLGYAACALLLLVIPFETRIQGAFTLWLGLDSLGSTLFPSVSPRRLLFWESSIKLPAATTGLILTLHAIMGLTYASRRECLKGLLLNHKTQPPQ